MPKWVLFILLCVALLAALAISWTVVIALWGRIPLIRGTIHTGLPGWVKTMVWGWV